MVRSKNGNDEVLLTTNTAALSKTDRKSKVLEFENPFKVLDIESGQLKFGNLSKKLQQFTSYDHHESC